MHGINSVRKGDIIAIETRLGQPTPQGGVPTYVNFSFVEGKNLKPIYGEKRDPSAPKMTAVEIYAARLEQLKNHDAYKVRERKEEESADDVGHFRELCKEVESHNWPTPHQMPEAWAVLASKALKKTPAFKFCSEISDDEWGWVRQAVRDAIKSGNTGALDAMAKEFASKTEGDPFA